MAVHSTASTLVRHPVSACVNRHAHVVFMRLPSAHVDQLIHSRTGRTRHFKRVNRIEVGSEQSISTNFSPECFHWPADCRHPEMECCPDCNFVPPATGFGLRFCLAGSG